ncbi:MAG TPA: hypothetical protein VFC00_29685 [Micromonosporaceae bacterium]|nr:hypothetical protein [Micromonosporaceae bacterium]
MTSVADAASPRMPVDYAARHVLLEGARPGRKDLARRRREEREARRVAAAGHRAAHRLDPLPDWHVVDLPQSQDAQAILGKNSPENAGFLAIGPAGVFAVHVVDHGRNRVLLAGDVVQINGRRPPYVNQAKQEAKRAAVALTRAVGSSVPVVPVLALVGSGAVSYYGLPKDCVVTTYRELAGVLAARGERITPSTAAKLGAVARHPSTWTMPTQPNGDDLYRWYPDGVEAADKKPTRR